MFELWSTPDLFYASLTFLLISLIGRLVIGLNLWGRVKAGKRGQYFGALLVNMLEPNTGQMMLKVTLDDHETSGQVYDHQQDKYVEGNKDPVAVKAHNDWTAGHAEIRSILVMVLGEDIPEFVIELLYLYRKGKSVDLVWWLSAVGTFLHLVLQLSELWITWQALPQAQQVMEGRDKAFEPTSTDDGTLERFAQEYGVLVRKVDLQGCTKITDKGCKPWLHCVLGSITSASGDARA